MPFPIFDAHLDLAYNALAYDRELRQPLESLQKQEALLNDRPLREARGTAGVTLPECQKAHLMGCMATLFDRVDLSPQSNELRRIDVGSASPEIAEARCLGQLAYYKRLEQDGWIKLVHDRHLLAQAIEVRQQDIQQPLPCLLTIEGADPIVSPSDLPTWQERGVVSLCLAHYGANRYAHGTGGDGELTELGRELLQEMNTGAWMLDLVHTADPALDEALSIFEGPVYVSHANCRTLCPSDRQLSDGQIKAITQRGGVVGVVCHNAMIHTDYDMESSPRSLVTMDDWANHVDYICQLTGSHQHVGIGSDLDGGFGLERTPIGIDSIQSLQKLGETLHQRDYDDQAIADIMNGNWMRYFQQHLPDA